MTERIPCVNEGCDHKILPATAAKTGGYCMPCKQEMEREAYQRYIEANRRDVDLYEGITDAVQVLKIMHEPRIRDPLIRYIPYKYSMEQVYLTLSVEQQCEMKQYAMERIRSDDEDTGKDILLYLVCYHDLPLTVEIPELLEREILYPSVLFKSASVETRDHLLHQVNHDEENRNLILMMLAYIGDNVVVQQFWRWKQTPPTWASEMYVAPERYALQAGWELTRNGQRQELFITPSYSLYEVKDGNGEGSVKGKPVSLLEPTSKHCPWCGGTLFSLMNVHARHPALQSVNWKSSQLDVQTCLLCSCYGVVYMEMDGEGDPFWSEHNVKPDGLDNMDIEEIEVAGLDSGNLDDSAEVQRQQRLFHIASEPRQPFHGSEWAMEPSLSQVGGHPGWVQDAEYPACPSCSTTMKAIGQLDGEMIQEYGEGMYYLFVCEPCQMTAVSYQQS